MVTYQNNQLNSLKSYFNEIGKCDILTSEEQSKLVMRAQRGDKVAQDRLISTNLRFVVSVAKQYIGQGIPLEDLISEGNVGILKAVEYYNPKLEAKFLTYASWWIRQAILQAITEQNRQVRLPANRISLLQQYNKAANRLEQELNREVGESEVLEKISANSIDVVRQMSVSYNIELDDGSSLLESIPNPESESPDAELMRQSLIEEVRMVLDYLDVRERTILKMYYGIGHPRSYTLEEIGEHLELTRERIRQLRNKALRELRRLDRRKKLENLKNY